MIYNGNKLMTTQMFISRGMDSNMMWLQTVEFIHSFTKYSQSAYAPDIVLGTKARAVDIKKPLKLKAFMNLFLYVL